MGSEGEAKVFGHRRTGSGSGATAFKELTKRDAQIRMGTELDKLMMTVPEGLREDYRSQMDGFQRLFSRFILEKGPQMVWDNILPITDGTIRSYDSLTEPSADQIKDQLNKLVVVKLNGGLGTSMGCQGPKSLIAVRNDLTFLDLTIQQIEHLNNTYNCKVPLVLMNSFNTDEDTQKVLRKYTGFNVKIYTFNQSQYPRINRETLTPVAKTMNTNDDPEAWYPPGHGDFYQSFQNSGLLKQFIDEGREYVFISNIDNLGATVDRSILNSLLNPPSGELHCEFLMEVTDKTRADIKGGTLCEYMKKVRLLEIAQVPKEHVDEFKSVKKFRIFNTNNLWINLKAMKRVLEQELLTMEIIVNPKTLPNGTNVIQLETAVGAAMKCFNGATGINVPRRRFLPVKKTDDLLLVMSNLYTLQEGTLVMSPLRQFTTTPLVKLGPNHFAKVAEFLKRFASIPDIMELDHLTVSGDVTFGRGIALRGAVIIVANHGDRIDIPDGARLENKVISGNLRILDH
ncbi:UTP--glucose-1-phosphate uridylyltransferase-like isoform X1 [Amphibalanus amphitrite]|uniref:UTP--glucose-1-phosphate uridylyltransferase-like isoform X1 n=1 Tax=Amphibalanus amphitrite TaxID=1232801 RepID=UPI001C904177|nr:UTP--glucose-1-phosphate uridylyltransferase-like isoform X1 [Amphibalanus amphitrite]XP_043199866.1 UTP--glucose-1-phosphate uridylyltransferase-like isoform X1 [Amphibalanus amphitrite]XP_043199867.1 UTP--glucose-1-phosphate uridylyltransferase-like isoform X1 [Amphibalanus amphitrite]XP_043231797.1 UTP--glucose-1-phosphate uridylyltransferase-like isoform X1 [Amphibalanus amphitrite]XP_043231798.1 UTP--glucose-1-phosphate uridylyltransferase-like isoform X1 [Amphibalanus amphitrite]